MNVLSNFISDYPTSRFFLFAFSIDNKSILKSKNWTPTKSQIFILNADPLGILG